MATTNTQTKEELTFGAILKIILRRKLIVGAFVLIAVLIGGYYAFVRAVPMYSSTAVVLLESRQDQVVDFQSVVGGLSLDASTVNTEVQILRSRTLAAMVVDRLNLTEDPEFNPALNPDSLRKKVITFIRSLIGSGDDQSLAAPDPVAVQDAARKAAATLVSRAVEVRNVPQSLVFQITVETTDPVKSSQIANTLAEAYIENQLAVKFDATAEATKWLATRVTELKAQLEASELELAEFRTGTELINPEYLAGLERQLKDTRARLSTTRTRIAEIEQQIGDVEAAGEDRHLQAAILEDSTLRSLVPRLSDPNIVATFDRQLDTVLGRLQIEIQRTEQQVSILEASVQEQSDNIDAQNSDLIALQQLTRESEAIRLLYEYFLTRLNQTSAQQGILQADSRVLSEAEIPNEPFSPRKLRIIVFSAVLGVLFGAGLLIYYELRLRTFRSVRELEDSFNFPVVGELPKIPGRQRKMIITTLKENKFSAASEAYRNLRTSLELINIDNPVRMVSVTSSLPGEGKTTTSMALALSYASMGKRTLLMECDIRRSVFKEYFKEQPPYDLQSVLHNECSLADAAMPNDLLGADILFGKQGSVNAADVFSSDRFAQVLQEARDSYDIVVLDTAPVLIVPDARIIAKHVDTTLFVAQWNGTTHDQLDEALRMLAAGAHTDIALVLNKVDYRSASYYGYSYGYGYGRGGRYGKYGRYSKDYHTS